MKNLLLILLLCTVAKYGYSQCPPMNQPQNKQAINGAITAQVDFTSSASNVVYSWTNSNPSIGLAVTGKGNLPSFNATNNGTNSITATIEVTPKYETNQIFSYTGAMQTFVVPAGVTSIKVDVRGSKGGDCIYNQSGTKPDDLGGNGGRVMAEYPVTPGQTLYIFVGGIGYNGGGNGGGSIAQAAGGGASDIRVGGTALTNRIVVAGGGGGGGNNCSTNAEPGGLGGGLIGGAGFQCGDQTGLAIGQGGTQSEGGAAGTFPATAGLLGFGGNAGGAGTASGGGGGGYYGGGGAAYGGGGGGSSYTGPLATAVTHTQGFQNGVGQIIITYELACASPSTKTFTYTIDPTFAATTTQTNVLCNGGTNGTASVNVSGGTAPYTYSWAPSGGTGATATGLSAGTYICTITDSNLTQITRSFTIAEPSALSATTSQTNVSCNGGSNGTASVVVTGGTGAYTYSWLPSGGTAATASGLASGTYTVTITDANLCQTTRSFTITQPTILSVSTNKTDVLCNGGTNGTASVNVSGGTGPYTYSWAPSGGTAATATGLPAGTYTVTITDANLCQTTRNFTINQPATLVATTSQTNATCSTLGQASVTAFGGTGPYTYSWAPSGGTAATAVNLTSGNYSCTITDANGCTSTKNFVITGSIPMIITSSQVNVSCNSGSNGIATVNASGGTAPYTYVWSPSGGTAATASGLPAGVYTCTVTDANGCQATKSVTITEPVILSATTIKTNVSCYGGTNGTASVSVTGGTGVYSYLWSPSGGTSASASGLAAGTYTVTIKDGNLCQIIKTVTIGEPGAVSLVGATLSSATVAVNYQQTITAAGASGSYTYSSAGILPPGIALATNGLLSGVPTTAGIYSFSITARDQVCQGNTSTTNFNITVAKGSQTMVFGPIAAKTYGDANFSLGASQSSAGLTVNYVAADPSVVEITGNIAHILKAGTTLITASQTGNPNYEGVSVQQLLTVDQKSITITAEAKSKVYGSVDPVLTYTASGLVGTDVLLGTLSRMPGENIGNYGINQGTLSVSANYTIFFTPANLTITAKPLTIMAEAKGKEYGAADPVLTYTVVGLIGTDTVTGTLNRLGGENVGAYTITMGTLSAGTNYLVNYQGANLTVTGRTLTVIADSKIKVYGDIEPDLTYTVKGLITGDQITGKLVRNLGENAGSYTINLGTLSAGINYNLNYQSANLIITKKSLTIIAETKTKVYGDMDPVLTYTFLPALVNGDKFTGALTRASGENAGDYSISQGTLGAGNNYVINLQPSVLTIYKAGLTVKANDSQFCQGAVLPAFTVSYSGFKNGDNQNSLSTKAIVTSSATNNSTAGTYILTPSGASATNYVFTYSDGVLAINALPQVNISSSKSNNISKGETSILTASGGVSYSWANANGIISGQNTAVLTVRPSTTTIYTVTAANASGCSVQKTYTIEVREDFQAVTATNLLSPNGDGINDNWVVNNIDMYPNNVVKVFDKAGRVVYSKRGYDNSWNGTINGVALSENTYYYVIDFGVGKLKQKGFITIVQQK